VDTTVNLSIDSTDVLHRWFIPALGGQVEAVPGEVAETSFRADEEGVYPGQSTQFSGTGFPAMRAWVRVVSAEDYEQYIEDLATDLEEAQQAVADEGVDAEAGALPGSEGG
jgi:heme/copper-type cytochrome/quinol oxidase subunit 2